MTEDVSEIVAALDAVTRADRTSAEEWLPRAVTALKAVLAVRTHSYRGDDAWVMYAEDVEEAIKGALLGRRKVMVND